MISVEGTNQIREYAISYLGNLTEISEELAINSPKFILICYADETKKYFKYDKDFCYIFSLATYHNMIHMSYTQNNQTISSMNNVNTTAQPSYVQPKKTIQTSTNTNSYNKKENKIPFGIIGITLVLVIGLLVFAATGLFYNNNAESSNYNNETYNESTLTPVAEPMSGEILSGSEANNASEITVTASGGESCVVKLKTDSGVTRLSFYVRAGDSVTVGVPAEYLYVYFASGDTWYGLTDLFGDNTSYSMDDEILDFTQYTWEYTLYPVSNGNFSETPIDASEFI